MRKKLTSGLIYTALFFVCAGILDNVRSLCFPSHQYEWYDIHAYFDSLHLESHLDRARMGALQIRVRVAETAVRQLAIETEIETFDTVASFGAAPDSFLKTTLYVADNTKTSFRPPQPTLLRFDFSGDSCDFRNVQH
jgi:hypothetical protein